jgi:hypothetical protein
VRSTRPRPSDWEAALHAAQKASALAAAPDVQADLVRSVSSTLREVGDGADAARRARERQARDEAMVARLVELRLPHDDTMDRNDWDRDEAVRLDEAYASAFAQYGMDVEADLASIGDAHAAIAIPLAAALDHWGIELRRLTQSASEAPVEDTGREQRLDAARRRHALAAALDHGDEWRDRLRAVFASEKLEPERLRELALSARVEQQPVLQVLSLAAACRWLMGTTMNWHCCAAHRPRIRETSFSRALG